MSVEEFRLEFDGMPDPLVRGNARGTWRERAEATSVLRDTTYLLMLERRPLPRFQKALATYHAYWCGTPLDRDNLIKGCKPILDEIVDVGILPDDGPDYVDIRTEYTRVPHHKDVKLVVTVSEHVSRFPMFDGIYVSDGGWCGRRWLTTDALHKARSRWVKASCDVAPAEAETAGGGYQCGGCSYFAAFDADYGLCANEKSPQDGRVCWEHGGCHQHSNIERGIVPAPKDITTEE